ncbi:MAG: biotin synthase [Candidatus Midichloriaceae bacterium]|jgi:biotin synthase
MDSINKQDMTNRWSIQEAKKIFTLPFITLINTAQGIMLENFPPNSIQVSTLLSIKTGSCPENCSYCPQSAHYDTGIQKESLMEINEVVTAAKAAKKSGSSRFCIGAAWRGPRDSDLEKVCLMIQEVKKLGLETCATLGLLTEEQAIRLKKSGLDYYNHNIDTSEEFYDKIISTRVFQDRLDTIESVRKSGIKVCCGGIIGMGETNDDRISMLVLLANLEQPPESIPINKLIKIPGTPLENEGEVDNFDFIKTIALARILMPKSYVRLSAGRESMSEEMQALSFLAGANSIFYGEKLLTSNNNTPNNDDALFTKLGLKKES